ncbi:MAG: hypothetical protein ACLFVX_04420 [Archaeoglobaceae archaeon]
MKKKLLFLTTIISLVIFVFVPLASADCEIGHLSAGDVYYRVEGASSTPYTPGEPIDLTYHIYPSNNSNSGIGGDCGTSRYYDVYTILEESNITATILYASGEKETRPVPTDTYERFGNGKHLCFAPDSTGIKEIRIEVSGYLPSTYSDRLTILSLDVSHAEEDILPPVQLVAVEDLEDLDQDQEDPVTSTEDEAKQSSAIQSSLPEQRTSQAESPAEIENLSLSVEPSYVEAQPGDTVNFTVTLDWTPVEWRGDLVFCGTLSAAGLEKTFEFQPVRPSQDPPIENRIPITLPENIPPFNYSVNLTVNAGSQKSSDETQLKINSSAVTPGFKAILTMTGLFSGLFLVKRKGNG